MRPNARQAAWLLLALALALPATAPAAERGRQTRKPSHPRANAQPDAAPPAAMPGGAPSGNAHEQEPEDSAAPAEEAGPEIETIGEEGMRAHFVEHAGPWSLHAENLPTDYLFRLWHDVGGPEVVSREPIDRAYTISVHRESAERILGRLLDGYSYTLHYDAAGKLEMVRVYSPAPNAGEFKTPRLVESLSAWRDVELAPTAGPAAAAQSN